ncbi:MAG TPA: tetratricopeptide repeat protein [Gemmatimonadaceae bacterium]
MNTYEQRSARAALDAARPAVARLDSSRGPEDLAADLIETWGAVESALRTLVGSTVLTGQPLIREARQRQVINFDQANALAEFQAVHDRLQDTSYRANDADVNSARSAFLKLDSALMGEAVPTPRQAPRDAQPAIVETTAPVEVTAPRSRNMPSWAILGAAAVLLIVLVGGGFLLFGRRGNDSMQQGIDAYRRGQREVAVSAFGRAAKENPKSAAPHVYLARMAREVGNFTLANQELSLALQADPNDAIALREMGANLLTQGNYELARRFYVRAVQADPTDKMAQGYLGCTLMRLNRPTEATNFLNRAGPGAWSNCTPTQTPPAQAAGRLPPLP